MEIKIFSNYLTSHIEYFQKLKRTENDTKLEKIIAVCKYETFDKGKDIVKYGEIGDKFYILVNGSVNVYIPIYKEVNITNFEYMQLMYRIKSQEKDLMKYKRILERNKHLDIDIEKLMELPSNFGVMRAKNDFIVEEEEKVAEYGDGYSFGELALLKKLTRNATIRATSPCICLSIDKQDYNKVIREIEEKKLTKQIEIFKRFYPFFKYFHNLYNVLWIH